jgi:threonine/homoserine/homoserine lactone efflux protein
MLLASGVNYGFRRSLPHMMGINFGFGVMVFLIGLGLAQVFQIYPELHFWMKWGSIAFMLYLAWKIASSSAPLQSADQSDDQSAEMPSAPLATDGAAAQQRTAAKPFSWWQAALFQWINPKAWAMGLSAVSAYVPEANGRPSLTHLVVVALMFVAINIPVGMTWTLFGVRLRQWLANDANRQAFNYLMAMLLILSLAPMIWA